MIQIKMTYGRQGLPEVELDIRVGGAMEGELT